MLILTVIQGPDKGRKFELPANEPQLIGRSSEALPVGDNTVSRRHAELTPDYGTWWVRDLDSQNGTFLNGVRLTQRAILHPGDQIRFGSTLVVFGQTEEDDVDVVRVMDDIAMDTEVERRVKPNEDSIVLSEPEPRAAAVDHLRVIYRLVELTARVTDRARLLREVMELVFEEFGPERGVIVMAGDGGRPQGPHAHDPDPDQEPELRPVVVKYATPPSDDDERTFHVSRTIVRLTIQDGEGVLSSNAMTDPRFAAGDSVQRYNIRSAICSPISLRDRVFGAIYVDSSIANYTYTPEQLALLNAIGRHTGLALASIEHSAHQLHTERLAAMGETVASLSHSIKNIIQGLRGGADVVEMGLKKGDPSIATGGWAILKRNLDRIVNLTMNMLTYSRQRTLELELTKMGPLIDECAKLLETQASDRGVAIIVDVDPEMPPVPVDPNLLHQALMNLIGNAMEASPEKTGAVTVRAVYHEPQSIAPIAQPPEQPTGTDGPTPPSSLTAGAAEISVLDNGPGIPRNKLRWIFEPFNTTKGTKGTGLGLAVTRRIIEDHRGRIRVESTEGRGTRFRVFLPADPGLAMDPSATAEERVPTGDELIAGL